MRHWSKDRIRLTCGKCSAAVYAHSRKDSPGCFILEAHNHNGKYCEGSQGVLPIMSDSERKLTYILHQRHIN